MRDEIFSVDSPKFEPDIFARMQEERQDENPVLSENPSGQRGVYNVTLAGSRIAHNKPSSKAEKTPELSLFSGTNRDGFIQKLKKAANMIKTGQDSYEIEQMLSGLEKLAGNNAVDLSNIAKLYIKIDKPEKAYELLERAEKLSPDDFKILYTHAICLYKQNDISSAETKLKKVTELKPDFMYAHYNLGNIYYKKQDYHKALDSFKKAMGLGSENPDIYFNIALTLEMLDYNELAKKFYTKCLELNPADKEVLRALNRLK